MLLVRTRSAADGAPRRHQIMNAISELYVKSYLDRLAADSGQHRLVAMLPKRTFRQRLTAFGDHVRQVAGGTVLHRDPVTPGAH
jgi:hypothetical protein